MDDDASGVRGSPEGAHAGARLDSWKEIAAYLKRDVTTVRRWEKREQLPVHRHLHDTRDSVYAYTRELDVWWQGRGTHLNGTAAQASASPSAVPTDRSTEFGRRFKIDTRTPLAWVAATLLAVSTVSLALIHFGAVRREPKDDRHVVLSVLPPLPVGDIALSPDGRILTFVAGTDENARLWIRSLDRPDAHPLAGTEGAEAPFWSPDGRFIAFGAGGKLKKIAASGGPVHTLCDARAVVGGTWGPNDVIVFAPGNRTPLYRVAAAGGEPAPLTVLDPAQGHNTHRWPHFLPDGRHFLYLARSFRPEKSGIYIGSTESTTSARVLSAESNVAYAPSGHVLFVRDRALLAQRFNASTQQLEGDPVQVVDEIHYNRDDSYASFSVSDHGEMAYQKNAATPRSDLAWFDRAGHSLPPSYAVHDIAEPSLSADGGRLAVTAWAGSSKDILLVDFARGVSRVTGDPSADLMPVWSPDGKEIVFASNRDGPADLYRVSSSGGEAEPLLRSSAVKHPTDWSADGEFIVFDANDTTTGWDVWVLRVDGRQTATPFLRTEFSEGFGRLSPDGGWMAYVSNESGTNEVYVRSFPSAAAKSKISVAGGTDPRWRRDGRELFYLAPDQKLMAVSVQTRVPFVASLPKALFESRVSHGGEWAYDVTPDGQRFIVSVAAGDSSPAAITVVLNWASGLSR